MILKAAVRTSYHTLRISLGAARLVRDADFDGRRVDGIRYASATGERGSNVVLFATQTDVVGAFGSEEDLWGSNHGYG